MKPIYIIDATGYLFRSYYAISGMTNGEGLSTNAVFGFIRSLLKLLKEFDPEYIAAVFDGPDNSIKREAIYSQYKSHRAACPPDLGYQIEWGKEFCKLIGIPVLQLPEVEADDTMGSIAVFAAKQERDVFLCTSDKDMCQLVSDKISILNTHKNNLILGPDEVKKNYNVSPTQFIDYLAIMGDASDNVPGIPGFGPKTAAQLLKQHGALEILLNNPDSLKGKKREAVVEHAELARLSKKLVTIDTALDIPKDWSFYARREPDIEELKQFYLSMNFHSLIQELGVDKEKDAPANYHLVDSEEELQEMVGKLMCEKEICVDTETTDIHPLRARLVGIGFCADPGVAFYVPANGKLGMDYILEQLGPLLRNSEIAFIGHNIKYDLHVLQNHGLDITNIGFDTMIASYVLNAHQRQHNLDALALEHFNKQKIPIENLIGKGKSAISMEDVPIEKVSYYCCEDTDYTLRLKQKQKAELEQRGLGNLFCTMEMPLVRVLAKMERYGIYLDIPGMEKMSDEVAVELSALQEEIHRIAGEEFNLNSPKQLSEILFGKMGITPPKKTATGFSTNAEVLELLRDESEIIEQIIQYRVLSKLKSTYLDTLPSMVFPKTKRIHCTFNQSVAATGRLSSQNPNLQNIPVKTAIGRKIRSTFRPEKNNWSYLAADYSQIELRLLAHLCEDPKLLDAFHHNQDVHAHTASILFGTSIENVTSQMRRQAKAVNFGVIYGQQAFGLSRELRVPMKDASAFIDMYFHRYEQVKTFVESCKQKAQASGKTVTITGRERLLPEIHNKNKNIRMGAERLAVNTPLQGSAADLIKLAMLEIDRKFTENRMRSSMILQVHDELIFEAPNEELPELQEMVKYAMENVWQLKVPLLVDIAIGKNWEQC